MVGGTFMIFDRKTCSFCILGFFERAPNLGAVRPYRVGTYVM